MSRRRYVGGVSGEGAGNGRGVGPAKGEHAAGAPYSKEKVMLSAPVEVEGRTGGGLMLSGVRGAPAPLLLLLDSFLPFGGRGGSRAECSAPALVSGLRLSGRLRYWFGASTAAETHVAVPGLGLWCRGSPASPKCWTPLCCARAGVRAGRCGTACAPDGARCAGGCCSAGSL